MDLKDLHKNAENIWKKLRLRTHILAIKMIKDKKDIPKEAKRPVKDLGYHLDLVRVLQCLAGKGKLLLC